MVTVLVLLLSVCVIVGVGEAVRAHCRRTLLRVDPRLSAALTTGTPEVAAEAQA